MTPLHLTVKSQVKNIAHVLDPSYYSQMRHIALLIKFLKNLFWNYWGFSIYYWPTISQQEALKGWIYATGSNLSISSVCFQEQIKITTDKPHLILMKHLGIWEDSCFTHNYAVKLFA